MAGHFSAKAKRSTSRPLAGSLNAIGLGVIVTDVELRQCELSLKDDEATARDFIDIRTLRHRRRRK
jgi:hypothetical protein